MRKDLVATSIPILPGQVWEDYRHSVDELVMVLEGKVEFEINGKILQPAAGEELLIPAGSLHSVRNKGTATPRWLYGYRTHNGDNAASAYA